MPVDFTSGIPRTGNKVFDWDNILTELREHPGDWGIVSAEGAKATQTAAITTAQRIKKGSVSDAVRGEFDAVARGTVVYARYVGTNREYAN